MIPARALGWTSGREEVMAINPTNPFKERHFPAYEHVSKLLAERGVEVDPSFVWRWVQVYAPERKKRCGPHPMETTPSASSKGGLSGAPDPPTPVQPHVAQDSEHPRPDLIRICRRPPLGC